MVALDADGGIDAEHVLIATNGYTSSVTPALQRRVVPIGSYIIVTEPLAGDRRATPASRADAWCSTPSTFCTTSGSPRTGACSSAAARSSAPVTADSTRHAADSSAAP